MNLPRNPKAFIVIVLATLVMVILGAALLSMSARDRVAEPQDLGAVTPPTLVDTAG